MNKSKQLEIAEELEVLTSEKKKTASLRGKFVDPYLKYSLSIFFRYLFTTRSKYHHLHIITLYENIKSKYNDRRQHSSCDHETQIEYAMSLS